MREVYAADWVLPIDAAPIERGGVAIEDGLIVAVGATADLEGELHYFDDAVVLPGFVNAHAHLEYAVYAGFGDGLPFTDWLALHIDRKRALDWDATVAIARLGVADNLASGTTTVADSSFTGAAAVAAAELGLRALVHLEVFGDESEELTSRFGPSRERIESALSERVRLGVAPHAPYTASLDLYRACFGLGLPVSTHLAESPAESEWLVYGRGPWESLAPYLTAPIGDTGLRALAREGLLSPSLVAAHCVTVEPDEIELLARHDVAVAHCPRSNALLGCGIAPLPELLAAGIRVGLGTDSPASTPSFDMFEEMRAAVALARARSSRSDALTARAALELATLGSARALGMDAEIGSLTPGKRADLAIVSLAGSAFLPWEDPVVALVFCGTPERVCRTIVDGETRYSRGGSEWHELRRKAGDARGRMLARSSRRRSA